MSESAQDDRRLAIIADDDRLSRRLARKSLEALGMKVLEAADGNQALDLLQDTNPALVLLDVLMPGMNGFEVCVAAREMPACEAVPILLLTALDDVESINLAYDFGATDFITKPVNWTLLKHRVRYILRASDSFGELRARDAKLERAQQLARLGYWELDVATDSFTWSAALGRVVGLPAGLREKGHEGFLERVHPEDRGAVRAARRQAACDGQSYTLGYRVMGSDGERFCHEQAEVRVGPDGAVQRLLGILQDITELKKAEEQVAFLAFRDSLTGLPNRRLLADRVEHAIENARRRNEMIACMFLDLDGFKHVNDTFGHSVGDELLKCAATRVRDCVRSADTISRIDGTNVASTVARFGGDEFVVILEGLRRVVDVELVSSRLLDSFDRPFPLVSEEVFVTPSIGVAIFPQDAGDGEELLRAADIAMYSAKSRGKNTFQFFTETLNEAAAKRLDMERSLRLAVEANELVLHYQPIYELGRGRLAKLEALVRWQRPEGLVYPGEFIALAEETGLIMPIGEWILRRACEQWCEWQAAGVEPPAVAVNLSARQFQQSDLAATIGTALEQTGMPPSALELELTEGTLMENTVSSIRTLQALKEMGVELAVDDFGTGYSSLSYLKRFPLDSLKIDRSFVADLVTDSDDASIISAIVALAHRMRLKVTAEGVETAEQLRYLHEEGCDQVQGFLLARPAAAATIPDLDRRLPGHEFLLRDEPRRSSG